MCPFYSNFRTKLVAVQRDPIHNLNFYEGVRLIVFCCRGPKGPYPQKSLKCNFLTMKQLVWTFSLNSKQILPHLGLQNVNLQLNLAFLAKEWHKLTTMMCFSDLEDLKTIF